MIETKIKALALGVTQITSHKTGKNYYKFGFYVDGNACSLMTNEEKGREIMKAPQYPEILKKHEPQPCEITLGVELTERGAFIDLLAVK